MRRISKRFIKNPLELSNEEYSKINQEIGVFFKRYRLDRSKTLDDIGDFLGLTKSTIFKLEENESNFTTRRLLDFMSYYRVDIEELMDNCPTLAQILMRG